jgi:predicted dienelactone hydrolase
MATLPWTAILLVLGVRGSIVAADCSQLSVGFRIVAMTNGPTTAIWYPTETRERPLVYAKDLVGSAARDAKPSDCQPWPLIVFSHGFNGCAIQSVFLTESLARAGYIVAAPDHRDAGCRADGEGGFKLKASEESFFRPDRWNESTGVDRRRDLVRVVDWMTAGEFARYVDRSRIGAVGHSMGGYAVLGILGAWPAWKDDRVRAAVLLSPYAMPFLSKDRLSKVSAPVMYQGAQGDLGITPFLKGKSGAFAQTAGPASLLELRGGNHFEWTNLLCLGQPSIDQCLDKKANARLINSYTQAFFDQYLKQDKSAMARLKGRGAARFERR